MHPVAVVNGQGKEIYTFLLYPPEIAGCERVGVGVEDAETVVSPLRCSRGDRLSSTVGPTRPLMVFFVSQKCPSQEAVYNSIFYMLSRASRLSSSGAASYRVVVWMFV